MIFLNNEARKVKLPSEPKEGEVSWKSPSNIALIKYWGKFGEQLPMNPSLSFTLRKSYTHTTIEYQYSSKKSRSLRLYFEKKRNQEFEKKLDEIIKHRLLAYLPWLEYTELKITSGNTFPHSAGIASSASSMSALAMCFLTMEKEILGTKFSKNDFYQNASFIARLCSGSACRSVYGGYNLWGSMNEIVNSSDAYAIPLNDNIHDMFKEIHDAVLIVDSTVKGVSSSEGHGMMAHHPYANGRYLQSRDNMQRILKAMSTGNTDTFFNVVENEALSLHALMMSSFPGYILLKPETLVLVNKITAFRQSKGIPVGFTIDAGPNVHVLYFEEHKKEVRQFIKSELVQYCEDNQWIDDKTGPGPQKGKPDE